MIQRRLDLEFSEQVHQGQRFVIVKDPVTGRYFRFTSSQADLIHLMSRPQTAVELAELASLHFKETVSPELVEAFARSLQEKLLLDSPEVQQQLARYGRTSDTGSLLYRKVWVVNPDRLFQWLLPKLGFAFKPGFHVLGAAAIAFGLVNFWLHWDELLASIPNLISVQGLALVWVVILAVTLLHEFAHGLTCCHFGGRVRQLGLMLIYFQPAFFCDVSDSYMFAERGKRIWVAAAGGYLQLIVWGLASAVWRVTEGDSWIHAVSLVVVLFAGLQTLVNFNPLIKLDGYYILSDILEAPNLRQRALDGVWRWLGGTAAVRMSRGEWVYGFMTLAFSTVLLALAYLAVFQLATEYFQFAGLVGFGVFATVTARKSLQDSFFGIGSVLSRLGRRRLWWLGGAGLVVLLTLVIQWDLRVSADARVVSSQEVSVRAETAGVVVEIPVREGARVKAGDVLARLRDFEKDSRLSELNGELLVAESGLRLLQAGARPEEVEARRKAVDTKRMELANARRFSEQRAQLQMTLDRKQSESQLDQQNLSRARNLFQGGLIARSEMDRAESAAKVRTAEIAEIEASMRALTESNDREADLKGKELSVAESELNLVLAGSRKELIRQKEAEVAKLRSQLDTVSREAARSEIKAPIDGIIATAFVERRLNQFLRAGDEFARVVATDRVIVEMQVPEKEMADVRIGHPVSVKFRGFPAQDFDSSVAFISPVATTQVLGQAVAIRAEIPNPEHLLKPDMTGVAKINCGPRTLWILMTRRLVRWIRTEFWHLLP